MYIYTYVHIYIYTYIHIYIYTYIHIYIYTYIHIYIYTYIHIYIYTYIHIYIYTYIHIYIYTYIYIYIYHVCIYIYIHGYFEYIDMQNWLPWAPCPGHLAGCGAWAALAVRSGLECRSSQDRFSLSLPTASGCSFGSRTGGGGGAG